MFHQVFIVDFEQENLADHAWTCLKFILFEKIGFLQIKKVTLHMHYVLPMSYFHNFANTFYVNLLLNFTEQKWSDYRACVCVFVCVCVCVCVCMCVFVFIFFHREGFFRLQDVWDILEEYGSMILCC